MGIRLIAMDLDQTVLNREGKLSETTRRVLEELLETLLRHRELLPEGEALGRKLEEAREDFESIRVSIRPF